MEKHAQIPTDPREWRPLRVDPSKGSYIDNPIAEPIWDGTRVLVFFREADNPNEWGDVEVLDEEGENARPLAARAFDQLRRSIVATEAVIDGIITAQTIEAGVSMEFDGGRPAPNTDLACVAV